MDAYVREKELAQVTSHTITTPDELRYALELSRKRGYAIDDEECEIGMRCLAAPIYDAGGQTIGALSLSGPVSRMSQMRYELELGPKLCEYAKRITDRICGGSMQTDESE